VLDDGVGPPETTSVGRGLDNMTARAARLGGRMQLTARPEGGTELCWEAGLGLV
jgi:signal transduction histidine kinase